MIRDRPQPQVIEWLNRIPTHRTYLSVITLGEIRKGIELCKDAERRSDYEHWLQSIKQSFDKNILMVDAKVAETWGQIEACSERTLSTADMLILATALAHGFGVLTRNIKHFQHPGLHVIDPWTTEPPLEP